MKAFVSHVQSYSKHEANYIFRLKDLAIGRVAKGYGLLRLPKMPELSGNGHQEGFTPWEGDLSGIRFADKARERQRQANLRAQEEKRERGEGEEGRKVRKKKTEAWSKKKEEKQERRERKEKRERKRAWKDRMREEQVREEVLRDLAKAKKEKEDAMAEEEEWERERQEERLAKRMRKGKLSAGEFDRLVGNVEEGEEGSFGDL